MSQEETLTKVKRYTPQDNEGFDLVIVGAGPAGMSAGVCAARADLKVLIIEKALPGGEASIAYKIENYMGFPGGILGEDLAKRMEDQLLEFPVYLTRETVVDILGVTRPEKQVVTDMGHHYRTKAVIFAMGLEPKVLGMDFETQFMGRGVSYYAQCDVESYRGKDVMVVGGGNCAAYAADFLAQHVNRVYMVHHSDHLRAVQRLKDSVTQNPKIDVMWDSRVSEVFGIDKVEKAKVEHTSNGQHTWVDVSIIYVYAGRIPPQNIVSVEVDVDEKGFIVTDEFMRTNIPGIYAAGDVRSKQIRQIATAVSDGMIAAINAQRDVLA